MKKFHNSLKMVITQCNICKEAWPVSESSKMLKIEEYTCMRCKRDKKVPKKFSFENNMVPSKVPRELQQLTQMEEMPDQHHVHSQ